MITLFYFNIISIIFLLILPHNSKDLTVLYIINYNIVHLHIICYVFLYIMYILYILSHNWQVIVLLTF